MQLNICEGEGGRAASAGRRPCHSCAPLLVSAAPPASPGPACQSTGGCFCTSVFKPILKEAVKDRGQKGKASKTSELCLGEVSLRDSPAFL